MASYGIRARIDGYGSSTGTYYCVLIVRLNALRRVGTPHEVPRECIFSPDSLADCVFIFKCLEPRANARLRHRHQDPEMQAVAEEVVLRPWLRRNTCQQRALAMLSKMKACIPQS